MKPPKEPAADTSRRERWSFRRSWRWRLLVGYVVGLMSGVLATGIYVHEKTDNHTVVVKKRMKWVDNPDYNYTVSVFSSYYTRHWMMDQDFDVKVDYRGERVGSCRFSRSW